MSQNPPKKKDKPPEHVEVFYCVLDGAYWMKLNGRFVPLSGSDLKLQLITRGVQEKIYYPAGEGSLDGISWVRWNAQQNRMVDYAGALSGKRAGVFEEGGKKYLVTEEASDVFADIPKKMPEPELFKAFIQELLPADADGTEQWVYFCYWLATALRTLRAGEVRPGQVVILTGEARCGKSLNQAFITKILGGRAANPMRYINDKTTFNADLAGAEHWPIEELRTTTDTRTRVSLGESLKELFNNRSFSVHPKNKQAFTINLFRRGSISLNNEPDILKQLPLLNDSINDKLIIFLCAKVRKAFDRFRVVDGTPSLLEETERDGNLDEQAMMRAFEAEIPAIRSWLLRVFKNVPAHLGDDRFVVKAYHHPELREQLVSFTSEARLLAVADEVLWGDVKLGEPLLTWSGKSSQLEKELSASDYARGIDLILKSGVGSLLGRLHKTRPERVSKSTSNGYVTWTIKPPPLTPTDKKAQGEAF